MTRRMSGRWDKRSKAADDGAERVSERIKGRSDTERVNKGRAETIKR